MKERNELKPGLHSCRTGPEQGCKQIAESHPLCTAPVHFLCNAPTPSVFIVIFNLEYIVHFTNTTTMK